MSAKDNSSEVRPVFSCYFRDLVLIDTVNKNILLDENCVLHESHVAKSWLIEWYLIATKYAGTSDWKVKYLKDTASDSGMSFLSDF